MQKCHVKVSTIATMKANGSCSKLLSSTRDQKTFKWRLFSLLTFGTGAKNEGENQRSNLLQAGQVHLLVESLKEKADLSCHFVNRSFITSVIYGRL